MGEGPGRAVAAATRERGSPPGHSDWPIWIAIVSLLVAGYVSFWGLGPAVDEVYHADQIRRFMDWNVSLNPDLTTLPLFHLALALLAKVAGFRSLHFLRLLVVGFAAWTIALFWKGSRRQGFENVSERVLQFTLVPILYPFLILLYTDIPSLCFLLLAFWGLRTRRYAVCALAAMLAVAIRQTAIVWFAFFFLLMMIDEWEVEGRAVSGRARAGGLRTFFVVVRRRRTAVAVFVVGFLGFLTFLVLNRGVAVGDAIAHPFPTFHVGNVFFCLLLYSVLFLPLAVAACGRVLTSIRSTVLAASTTGLGLVVFLTAFTANHVYNRHDPTRAPWFIRNVVLQWITDSTAHRLVAFIPIALAIFALFGTKLTRREYYLLYPFSVLFLVPSWLIEQRYYLVPFAFLLLFRAPLPRWAERSTIVYELVLTALTVGAVASGRFFL